MASSRILLTGASGTIGKALRRSFETRASEVVSLTRSLPSAPNQVKWDPQAPLAPDLVSGFDAVIHLAGESIVGRWTAAKKARIRESRAAGTRNLAEALSRTPQKPRVFISASAIGYYGNRGDQVLREDSASGNDFLSEVCRQWEAATQPAVGAGIRTVNLRIGVMLSAKGGALQKMLTPFRMGVGGRIGDGRQWWSWIAIDDLVGAVHHAIKADLLQGPVNAVAPKPVTNAEFTRVLAEVLHRPAIFPMPAFAARLAFGDMADELLLASQRVEPSKLVGSGYPFQHSELKPALERLLKR